MVKFQVNYEEFRITFAGTSIELLPKEFALFKFLYQNHNQAFTRETLLDRVWPLEEPVDRTVDDHIYRLRKKLKNWDSHLQIDTVRGIGYRLRLLDTTEKNSPSLKDAEFHQHFNTLLTKYHLFGQGEALQTLAGQQQILGVKLDPFYEMYTELLKGNWGVLLNEKIPFWERAYFIVVLYSILVDDPSIGKDLIERVLENNQLPLARQWELQAMDLVFFQLWCGEYEEANTRLHWAKEKVEEHQLDGFKLAVLIQEILPLSMMRNFKEAEQKMDQVEIRLQEKPYLRELSYFNISKGICLIGKGDKSAGNRFIQAGIDIMKQAKFELQYLHALTHITHLLRHLSGKDDPLFKHYHNLRSELIRKNNGLDLSNLFVKQLNLFL